MKKKIAVIGSGISGLSASYYLRQKFHIQLFEQNDYLGGHTHTHTLTLDSKNVNVDSGFIVFNNFNYHNFIKFIKELKIKYQISDMSFSVTSLKKKYEWSGKNLKTILCSPNIVTLRYWRILKDIFRFNKITRQYIETNKIIDETVDIFLKKSKFTDEFINLYFYPMCSSIWSNPIGEIKKYKIHFILSFFSNHGLINIFKKRPIWYTICNGSRTYVDKVKEVIGDDKIVLKKVVKINTKKKKIHTIDGTTYTYDHIILATHTDDVKKILNNISKDQINVLNMVKYKKNIATIHTDETIMPLKKANWSSWNFTEINKTFALTYWMNLLQNLNTKINVFVSINCESKIRKSKIIKKIVYKHPVFTAKIQDLHEKLTKIQGHNNIWFVGAWQGYGFHEDGIKSSLRIIKQIK